MRYAGPVLVLLLSVGIGTAALLAPANATPPPGPTVDVRTLYLGDCATCHGSDGAGTTAGPSLVGVGAAALDYELSTGRMPLAATSGTTAIPTRHEPAYSAPVIGELVAFVDALTGGTGPRIPVVASGDVADGGVAFRLQCAACHAWAGDGGALVDREAPPLHDATATQIAEAVRIGPGRMPAFGAAALTDQQVDDVAAYVRYLSAPSDRGGIPLDHVGPVAEGAVGLAAIALLAALLRWIGERG